MKLSILTGPVQSGKTTWLLHSLAEKKDVCGVLSPVIKGKRYFMDVKTFSFQPMEAEENDENVLSIGKFRFLQTAFDWASEILLKSISQNPSQIIIDEIGPLELQEKGFATILKEILKQKSADFELLLVIREHAIDEVLNYFSIDKKQVNIINITSL